jgi:hypothetical protein
VKTKKDFAKLVERCGGTLEEDTGFRNNRVFQAVAPDGKLWKGDDVQCLRIETCKESADADFQWARSILEAGLRDITPEEADFYAED